MVIVLTAGRVGCDREPLHLVEGDTEQTAFQDMPAT